MKEVLSSNHFTRIDTFLIEVQNKYDSASSKDKWELFYVLHNRKIKSLPLDYNYLLC